MVTLYVNVGRVKRLAYGEFRNTVVCSTRTWTCWLCLLFSINHTRLPFADNVHYAMLSWIACREHPRLFRNMQLRPDT